MKLKLQRIPIYTKQAAFRSSSAWVRGFCAGRGAGKTFIGAQDMILEAKAGDQGMIVSPTYVMLEDTTWPVFNECCELLGVFVRSVKSPTRRIFFKTQDGGDANVVFRSGEEPELLRGPSKSQLWLDEASIMHEDVWNFGVPVLRHRGKMGRLTMTFTPRGRQHWTFEKFYRTLEVGDLNRNEQPDIVIGGGKYVKRANTDLIRAHTLDNPFLPEEYHDNIAAGITTTLAAQELGGEFIDLQGLIFRREWFTTVDEIPRAAERVRYWDKAASVDSGDYSAGVLMAKTADGEVFIEDVVRGQWSYLDRNKMMLEVAKADAAKYGNRVRIYFEQEGGSGGKESAQMTLRLLAPFPVHRDIVSGQQHKVKGKVRVPGQAKITRSQPFAAQAEAGNVRLKRASWNNDWLDEIVSFPEFRNDDQVDATSGAFNKLVAQVDEYAGHGARLTRPQSEPIRHGVQLQRRR